jgi:polyphosphate glucokinase
VTRIRIGIDIGGSGMKAGRVDLDLGALVGDRIRVETPQPATPETLARATAMLVDELGTGGPLGIGFPAVVRDGWVSTANNIDKSWIGVNAIEVFEKSTGRKVHLINDADAAGLAEAAFGAAQGVSGTVVILTFGTGIGSALLLDGKLVPNVELGQIELGGFQPAEMHYAARARRREDLSWLEWAKRINEFIRHVARVFSPTLIVVGGGVSRKWDEFGHLLTEDLPIARAGMSNNAGIVGAATLAAND